MVYNVIKTQVIAECLRRLRELPVHRNFIGYLCTRRVAAIEKRDRELIVDFKGFFDTFLRAPGNPEGKPYFIIFIQEPPSKYNRWFNKNVAGSFAPSSLRQYGPFRKVVTVTGKRRQARYTLKKNHWVLAKEHLTRVKVPAVPLAAVLYRNYAFNKENPTTNDLLSVFKDEFGYTEDYFDYAKYEFGYLYDTKETFMPPGNWFEEWRE